VKRAVKRALFAVAAAALVTFSTRAQAVGGVDLKVTKFALETGVFNSLFAKELCSCQFVDGLSLDDCIARDNVPSIAHDLVNISVDPDAHTVSSAYRGHDVVDGIVAAIGIGSMPLGGSATAQYDDAHPEFGCVLTKLPSDP
jgi:hypothetical protein